MVLLSQWHPQSHIRCMDGCTHACTDTYTNTYIILKISVPARLGKGQGAKEIGHNLVREQPKFGHNLVRKAFYKHFYIGCLKTQKNNYILCLYCAIKDIVKTKLMFFKNYFTYIFFLNNSVRARVNRAGRKPVRAGRSAPRNRPSWNIEDTTQILQSATCCQWVNDRYYWSRDMLYLLTSPSGTHRNLQIKSNRTCAALQVISHIIYVL